MAMMVREWTTHEAFHWTTRMAALQAEQRRDTLRHSSNAKSCPKTSTVPKVQTPSNAWFLVAMESRLPERERRAQKPSNVWFLVARGVWGGLQEREKNTVPKVQKPPNAWLLGRAGC
jgi:hypothetical protein